MAVIQNNLLLIAGPCQIETPEHCYAIAEALKRITSDLPIDFIFKASYDKANRTSHNSPRGVGLERGREILQSIREDFNLSTTTDVHEFEEVGLVSPNVDVLQIPALLCRQTDLIAAAGQHAKRAVNIKKGQFMAPWQMRGAVDKARIGNRFAQVWITERGTAFGHGDLVVDMRSLISLRKTGADKIIFDASHSCQRAYETSNVTSGDLEFIEPLARAALAVGVDGLFIEVHDRPWEAKSDGSTAYPLGQFRRLLERLLRIWEVAKPDRHTDAKIVHAIAG